MSQEATRKQHESQNRVRAKIRTARRERILKKAIETQARTSTTHQIILLPICSNNQNRKDSNPSQEHNKKPDGGKARRSQTDDRPVR
jgi:hypothetical protein